MGQDNSKSQSLSYISNYIEVQKQQHPFFGTITHLTHRKSNTKHFLKTFKFATEKQLATALKKANKRKQLSQKKGSSNIIRLTDVQSDQNNELCGITYYLHAVYEDYTASLGDLIRQRKDSKQHFPQDEVVEMLRGICNGLLFLQDNGYKNYTVTKESIIKETKDQNKSYSYKAIDAQLAKEMLPYIRLLNSIPIQKGTYLPPQALSQLRNRNSEPELSLKSDVFSLAMVTLQMCLLEPLDYVYNYDKYQIKQSQITQKLNSLKLYSSFLKQILAEMLQINQQQRIGAVSLRQKLNISDSKSTTDKVYSGTGIEIDNSNVTTKTHKISYPTNTTNPKNENNSNINNVDQAKIGEPVYNRIHRVQTVDKIKYQHFPVTIENSNNISRDVRNVGPVFDANQGKINHIKDLYNISTNTNTINTNISTNANINMDNRPTICYPTAYPHPNLYSNIHYLQPNVLKPVTVPITSNNNEFSRIPEPKQIVNANIFNSNSYAKPNNIYPTPMPNIFNPILQQPQKKLPEISIPQINISTEKQKASPQTPINNLRDSNPLFGSQQIGLLKLRCSKSLSDSSNEVLTSLNNPNFKKAQNKQESNSYSLEKESFNMINETNLEYESPSRYQREKIFTYASNQSTPIRKVQALQSHPRNNINQIIKESEEEEYEFEANTLRDSSKNKSKEINMRKRNEIIYENNGPRTYGKHHFTNGAVYEGEFDSLGNFCGNGILYYPNGKVCYSGGWVQNSFHGFGVLNNQITTIHYTPTNYENFGLNDPTSWNHYEGQFCMDKKNGFGTLYMVNGDKFSGCFVNDVIEGYGTFTSYKGERVSGIWTQNILKKF